MHCTITSPKKTTIYPQISSLRLPAYNGQVQILPGHAEAFLLLSAGEVILKKNSASYRQFQINDGVCYVKNDRIILIFSEAKKY